VIHYYVLELQKAYKFSATLIRMAPLDEGIKNQIKGIGDAIYKSEAVQQAREKLWTNNVPGALESITELANTTHLKAVLSREVRVGELYILSVSDRANARIFLTGDDKGYEARISHSNSSNSDALDPSKFEKHGSIEAAWYPEGDPNTSHKWDKDPKTLNRFVNDAIRHALKPYLSK